MGEGTEGWRRACMKPAALKPPSCMYPPIESPTTPPLQTNASSVPLERLRSATPPTDRRPPTAFQRTDTKTRTATDKETALNTQLLRTATPRAVQTQKAEHAAPTPDAARDGAQTTGRDGQTRGHGRPRFRGSPRWVRQLCTACAAEAQHQQGRETIDGGKGPLFGLRGETAGQTRGAEGRQRAFEKLCGGSAALHGAVCRRRALETAVDPARGSRGTACRRLCWVSGVDSALVDCWKTE